MRTYADNTQVIRLAWVLFEHKVRDAKEYLEPKGYKINGTNYEYRKVQASLDMAYALEKAIRNGTLKATKRRGFQRAKRTNNTK